MAKPPTSVRSIRLDDDLWARIKADAERRDMSVNGVISALLHTVYRSVMVMEPITAEEARQRFPDPPRKVAAVRVKTEPMRFPTAPIGSRLDKKAGKTKR